MIKYKREESGDIVAKLSKEKARKYNDALTSIKKKYITVYDLSQATGIKERFLREDLAYFDPMIRLDQGYDIRPLLPKIAKYAKPRKPRKSKETEPLPDLGAFIYDRMTLPGGIFDRDAQLDIKQLRLMKRIINEKIRGMKK